MTFFTIQKARKRPATPINTGASDANVVELDVPIEAIKVEPVVPRMSIRKKGYVIKTTIYIIKLFN